MLEAEVDEHKIAELLIKYWDLRPSEATSILQDAVIALNK